MADVSGSRLFIPHQFLFDFLHFRRGFGDSIDSARPQTYRSAVGQFASEDDPQRDFILHSALHIDYLDVFRHPALLIFSSSPP